MAGTVERTLALKLIGDVGQINKPLGQADRQLGRLTKSAVSWGKALSGALVLGGLERIVGSVGEAVTAFREEEQVVRAFSRTIRNMRLPLRSTTAAMDEMAARAVDLGFDDAETVAGMDSFLKRTGSIERSSRLMALAWDIARSKQVPLSVAIKQAEGIYNGSARALKQYGLDGVEGMEAVDRARRIERGKAAEWARNHPMAVTLGRISDAWAGLVGNLMKGDVKGMAAALGGIGEAIADGLFGGKGKDGIRNSRVAGLVNQFGEWGAGLAEGILEGMTTTDWGKKLGEIVDAAVGAVRTAADNGTLLKLALLGGALATAVFAVDIFVTAASKMFGLPRWALGAGAKGAGLVVGAAFRVAMFAADRFITGASVLFATLAGSARLKAIAGGFGRAMGAAVRTPMLAALGPIGLAIMAGMTIDELLTSIGWGNDSGVKDRTDRIKDMLEENQKGKGGKTGFASGTPYAPKGWAMVGERGPELMRFRGGEQVLDSRASMAAMGAGTTVYAPITVNAAPGADGARIGAELMRYIDQALGRGHRFRYRVVGGNV